MMKTMAIPALLLMLMSAAAHSADGVVSGADVDAVRAMNDNYLRSWRQRDMEWFRQNLSDEYVCTAPDGSVLSKREFISYPDQSSQIADSHVEELNVTVYGDTAVVTGNNVVHWKNGKISATRYTDTYAKVGGKWKAVSAQLTTDKAFTPKAS